MKNIGEGLVVAQKKDPYGGPSFSMGNRLLRAIWSIVYLLLFRISPRPFHAWRALLLRLFGAKIGRGCHVYSSVKVWAPWNLVLGDYVGIGDRAIVYCMDKVSVGDYTVISQGSHLCAGGHDFNTHSFKLITAPILIGSRVWLCADTFVGAGVSIAEGSVIGARSVVAKSIHEPWFVWAGVPAKKIGVRDKEKVLR